MRIGSDFPVADYLIDHILDATTISRKGGWWTAVLLLEDPKSKEPYIGLYRWQLVDGSWKNRAKFAIRSKADQAEIVKTLESFASKMQ